MATSPVCLSRSPNALMQVNFDRSELTLPSVSVNNTRRLRLLKL